MKTVGEAGEERLVRFLTQGLRVGERVVVGCGDDCAVVRDDSGGLLILKTDCIIEGIHFLPSHRPELVGWKAMARVLSDFAAMAAKPLHALVTMALPKEYPVRSAVLLRRGMERAANAFGVSIVGGETSRSTGGLFLSVAMQGVVEDLPVLRSGSSDGDAIIVSGVLGASFPTGHHLRFRPRVREALWLKKAVPVSAMMDLSDGLASDLPRLCEASNLGFELHNESLPLRKGAVVENALRDGEDYELLFTISPQHVSSLVSGWQKNFPRVPLTRIGTMCAEGRRNFQVTGFQHFLD